MRKLSVPYTIVRGGIYYLNLRWNNQFIRQSLATKDPMEAVQKVNQLAPMFSKYSQTCFSLTQYLLILFSLVEAAGIEPASANPPPVALHA